MLLDLGSRTWLELFLTTRRGTSGEVGLLPLLHPGDSSPSAHSAKACMLGIGKVGNGGRGDVGADAGRGGRVVGEGNGKADTAVLMASCGVPFEEDEEDE